MGFGDRPRHALLQAGEPFTASCTSCLNNTVHAATVSMLFLLELVTCHSGLELVFHCQAKRENARFSDLLCTG